MRKIILLSFAMLLGVMFSACGPHMYKTQSAGKDNVSYVIVLTEGTAYDDVSVVVDGVSYQYGKVYKVKAKRKAHPLVIEPGKHNVKVMVGDAELTNEDVYIGLQETKIIRLR